MRRPRLLPTLLALAALLAAAPAASAATSSPVKHVRVNGISIGYRIVGSGRPLVLIPGFAFTMAEWDPKLVGALSAGHRVVLFDNRGVATTTDTPRNVLSIDEMASDTSGLIRARSGDRSRVHPGRWGCGTRAPATRSVLARPPSTRPSADSGGPW